MATAEAPAAPPPPAAPEPPPAVALPPEAIPAGAAGLVPPGSPDAPHHFVEQRVVSAEVKTRNYDDPDDDTADLPLLRVLPGTMADAVAYPLTYRLAVSSGHAGVTMRQAASDADRATQYICIPFYKPLSRCFGGRG